MITLMNVTETHIRMKTNAEGVGDTKYSLFEPLRVFVNKLKRKRPNWRFVVLSKAEKRIALESTQLCSVAIVEGEQQLGSVSIRREYSAREHCDLETYKVRSDRIQKKRGSSKNESKTTKEAVALRTCLAMMRPDTEDEMKNNVSMELANALTIQTSHTNSSIQMEPRKLQGEAVEYAQANREAFCRAFPQHTNTFRTLDALAEEDHIVSEISVRQKVILVADSSKLRVFADTDGTKLFEDDLDGNALPEWVRRKMGLLKLVAAKQFVRGVGVRVNDNVFAITTEVEGEAA